MNNPTTEPIKLPHLHFTEAEAKLLHRMGGTAGAALQADPEWRRAARALVALAEASKELNAVPADPTQDLAERLTQAALAGEPIKLIDEATGPAEHAAARDLAAKAIRSAQADLETDLNHAARSAVPSMFAALGAAFAALWSEITTLQEVARLGTAENAIAAGRTNDWARWRALLTRHAALRQEQALLLKRAPDVGAGIFPEALVIPNAPDVFPRWAHLMTHGRELTHVNGETEHIAAPWPTDNRGALSLVVAASDEFVTYAVSAGVTPWIPTPAQLTSESQRLETLLLTEQLPAPVPDPSVSATLPDPVSVGGGRR